MGQDLQHGKAGWKLTDLELVEIERPQLLKLYDETLIKWGLNDSNGIFFIKMNMLNIKGRGKGIKTFIGI